MKHLFGASDLKQSIPSHLIPATVPSILISGSRIFKKEDTEKKTKTDSENRRNFMEIAMQF